MNPGPQCHCGPKVLSSSRSWNGRNQPIGTDGRSDLERRKSPEMSKSIATPEAQRAFLVLGAYGVNVRPLDDVSGMAALHPTAEQPARS